MPCSGWSTTPWNVSCNVTKDRAASKVVERKGRKPVQEPDRQVEIQLGHMCNNRCVFCVSGQRTAMREALPMPLPPIVERIEAAYEAGHRKITLLGGEPTLQPHFLLVVRRCVELGFEEIVIFTNGVKTARPSFIDEVLQTGGRFTWRISIQGATKESHERTTRRPGSFDRIVRSMENLAARGQRITVNMCVVRSNYQDVDRFPDLLLPYGVQQLHLDMVRPRDAGIRSEAEFEAMLPDYRDLVRPLSRMVAGFPDGFDVNIGNLPYCIAPDLARWIHHDGEQTFTIAVDGDDRLSEPWDKYQDKRTDKFHPSTCEGCVFRHRCNGIFQTYARLRGVEAFQAVDETTLARIDPERRLFPLHLWPWLRRLDTAALSPFGRLVCRETGDREITVELGGSRGRVTAVLRPPDEVGAAATDLFSFHLLQPGPRDVRLALWRGLARGREVRHPLGDDAASVPPTLAGRIRRLRAAAPFPPLAWTEARLRQGQFTARFEGKDCKVELYLGWQGRPTGGYRLLEGTPSPPVVSALRRILAALGGRGDATGRHRDACPP